MKNKTKSLILTIVFISIVFLSFYIGLNFYHPYDANRDGKVDIRDLLKTQKYLIERRKGE